jgi:ABC-type protease/lipase transport system fused ATPase/permease subunit
MIVMKILGAIFAIAVLVKLIVFLIHPKAWMRVAETLLKAHKITTLVYLVLAIIAAACIFTRLDIIEVAAVMFFTTVLMAMAMIPYSKAMLKLKEEISGSRLEILRNSWLAILVWLGFAIWILWAIFGQGAKI